MTARASILDAIVAAKRREIAALKADGTFAAARRAYVPAAGIRDFAAALRPGAAAARAGTPGSPAAALRPGVRKLSPGRGGVGAPATGRVALIAEIKKASPSRGAIRPDLDPVETARLYAANGAAAISVLTERDFFHGDPSYLRAVREAVSLPLLRKDFLVDPDQVFESRALGADAILLIAAILSDGELETLLGLAGDLGLGCLVEVHDEAELARALAAGARLIGINNRDLSTFRTDLEVTRRLAGRVPPECTVVAESGIFTREDVERVGAWGAHAVLVGEALVREADVGAKVRELACCS